MINNRYEKRHKLGAGWWAEVYMAYDHVLAQNVALKLIKTEHNAYYKKHDLRNEVNPLLTVRHPNILGYRDCGVVNGNDQFYIVTEFANGGKLEDHIKGIDEVTASNYTLQILDAMQALHAKNIIHLDLKPDNVLLDYDVLKISDFGYCRHTRGSTYDGCIGCHEYMSPERHRNNECSRQDDIWAVGTMLYQMLKGKTPCANKEEVLAFDVDENYFLQQGFAVDMAKVLAKALAHDKNARYQSAAQFRQELFNTTIKQTKIMRAEQGHVGWDWDGGSHKSKSFSIKFKTPFQQKPILQTSITKIDASTSEDKVLRMHCVVHDLDREGAVIELKTWNDNDLCGAQIQWTALGE